MACRHWSLGVEGRAALHEPSQTREVTPSTTIDRLPHVGRFGVERERCSICQDALGGHREPGQKIKVLDYFDFNLSRCSFCGLCAEVCPTKPVKALIMSEDYELGAYSRAAHILRVDELYDGVPIQQYTR